QVEVLGAGCQALADLRVGGAFADPRADVPAPGRRRLARAIVEGAAGAERALGVAIDPDRSTLLLEVTSLSEGRAAPHGEHQRHREREECEPATHSGFIGPSAAPRNDLRRSAARAPRLPARARWSTKTRSL